MSWISSLLPPGPGNQDRQDHGVNRAVARQRAATRVKLVANLRNAAQGLAGLQARVIGEQARRQNQEGQGQRHGHEEESKRQQWQQQGSSGVPLLDGDAVEAQEVCSALEQCLFHRIRTKDFRGVMPFWAYLERLERLPIATGNARPGLRERRLSSVRNTVGAVASCRKVSTPIGRARSWIRQCLVCKCLEACVGAVLAETRLVQVFYEPTALARCEEGSTILLRLCAALEAFDIAVDADQSQLDISPAWPILDQEAEWDARFAEQATAGTAGVAPQNAPYGQRAPSNQQNAGASASSSAGSRRLYTATDTERSDGQQQQWREAASDGRGGGWIAAATSEIDKFGERLSQEEKWSQLDSVLTSFSSKVDKAVQSLDGTLETLFGDKDIFADSHTATTANSGRTRTPLHTADHSTGSSSSPGRGKGGWDGGWVEIRGDGLNSSSSPKLTDARYRHALHSSAQGSHTTAFAGGDAGLGRQGRRGKARVFGVPLEELILNPDRCAKGLLDPALGVPDAVSNLMAALSDPACYNTAGIFSEEASESELFRVVKSLEKSNQVPDSSAAIGPPAWLVSLAGGGGSGHTAGGDTDGSGRTDNGKGGGGGHGRGGGVSAHALAMALLFFLHRLPEPLLTFRRREAFLSCEVIPDVKARVRNVKLLVEDLPWAHKPLLLALIDLLATMTSSTASPNDHSSETAPVAVGGVAIIDETDLFHSAIEATGGVTARDAAESFAPALLRPPPVPSNSRGRGGHGSGTGSASDGVSRGGETSVGWEEELAATSVVELLLSERDSVFKDLRAEQANREEKLSQKVKRLGQLQRMLAAKVLLERRAHLAVVISIWRRLETAEKKLLQGATAEDEASVGLQPISDTKGPGRGYEPTESSASKSVGVGIPSNLSGGGGGLKTTGPCGPRSPMNVDEDVRELENMFLGIEGDDPSWADGDTKSVSNNDVPGDDATSAAARELREQIDHDMQGTSVSMEGEGAAETGAGSDIAGKVFDAGKSTMQAFSIEEDEGEGAAAEKLAVGHGNSTAVRDEHGTLVTTSRRGGSRRDVDSDFEDTEKLLGSIAESLTPTPGATPLEKGANGSNTDHVSSSLAITKSELALVNLMVEAGEESGEMLATAGAGCSSTKSSTAVNFGSSDNIDTSALGGRSEKTKAPLSRGYRRANSGFDDVLIEGSTSHGSSSSINAEDGSGAVDAGVRGDTRTRDTPQVVRDDPASSSIAAETVMDSDSKSAIVSSSPAGETDVKATKNATSTLAATDTLEDIALTGVVADAPPVARSPRTVLRSEVVVGNSTEATRTSLAERHEGTMKQVFSLEHQRWVSCGFKSGLVVDMLGPASSVRAALVDAGSVLALDSLNYFLWRYPQSATRVVTTFVRRQHTPPIYAGEAGSGGGGDFCPFPSHVGHLTRLVADLLCLPPVGSAGNKTSFSEEGKDDGSEPGDICALRLARLEAWKLLDSPYAFQEMVSCAVLAMDAAQLYAQGRGHHPHLYQESLVETRRILQTCLRHTPDSVDSLWAAATVEGGISLDPADTSPPPAAADSTGGKVGTRGGGLEDPNFGGQERGNAARESAAEELMRVLGLSDLAVEDEELGKGRFGASRGIQPEHARKPSFASSSYNRTSSYGGLDNMLSDNRLPSDGVQGAGGISRGGSAMSRDPSGGNWLLGGEEGRTGMIDSIAGENNGLPGPLVLDIDGFRAQLLRPSQILSDDNARALAGRLPDTVSSCDWVNLYSDARHGTSLQTLLARCDGWQPTLVIIGARYSTRDPAAAAIPGSSGEEKMIPPGGTREMPERVATRVIGDTVETAVFGGFASGAPWQHGKGFSGDGRSFLFSFNGSSSTNMSLSTSSSSHARPPQGSVTTFHSRAEAGGEGNQNLRTYAWSGTNRFFMMSDENAGLGMGSGGKSGEFGFFVQSDLRKGTTGRCETFNNDPLIPTQTSTVETSAGSGGGGGGGTFDVTSIEVWGFRHAQRSAYDDSSLRTAL